MVEITKAPRRPRRPGTVAGHHLPPPRPTRHALRYVLLWFGLPLVTLLALLDLLLYLLFTRVFGVCYGIFCLFG
jgi:hypothetical protein